MTTRTVEESGDTLTGALDGQNHVFTTSQDMRMDRVIEVYVNGLRRIGELDDGYDVVNARQIRLRQAPVPEDTVAVGYSADAVLPGIPNAYPRGLMTNDYRPEPLLPARSWSPCSLRVVD